jgi:hypothetical protein
MYAVACADRRQDHYGLFANDDGSDLHWEYLNCSAPVGNKDDGKVLALDSLDGSRIFVGTQHGQIFDADPLLGRVIEMDVPMREQQQGEIWRLRSETADTAYALYNGGNGKLLQLSGNRWNALGSEGVAEGFGPPTDEGNFLGFDLDIQGNPTTVFLTTDNNVYVSRDKGTSWRIATKGLPLRAHCTHLSVARHTNGQRFLYLSTFGRSLWRAVLA